MDAPRRTQSERRETADRRLLTAAYRLISEHEMSTLTCEEVGKLAGYSRGHSYQRFGSKEGMLVTVVERLCASRRKYLERRARVDASGIEKVLDFVDLHLGGVSNSLEMAAFFRVLAAPVLAMPKLNRAIDAARAETFEDISRVLRESRTGDRYESASESEGRVRIIYGLMTGMALQHAHIRREREFNLVRSDVQAFLRSALSRNSDGLPQQPAGRMDNNYHKYWTG
jgi:AcrR family transcriptional regulator